MYRYPPPLPMFEAGSQNLLRCLRCQEDLCFKILGPPLAGTIGGPWEEGVPSQPPPPFSPPPPPLPLFQHLPARPPNRSGDGIVLHAPRGGGALPRSPASDRRPRMIASLSLNNLRQIQRRALR